MKDYFNCQETPMMLGMWDQEDKILRRYPIEPLHVFLLGRLVAIFPLYENESYYFYWQSK